MDRFAKLAFEGANTLKEELKEITPRELGNQKFMPSSKMAPAEAIKDYKQLCIEYDNELEELRKRFEPFLQSFTPAKEAIREKIALTEFAFRYQTDTDKRSIDTVFEGSGEWERVTIPDYRGPVGRWKGYYRTEFKACKVEEGERLFLRFLGVDYIAKVYLNGNCLGIHEGFFEPFEYDITDYLRDENVLVVEIANDAPTIGLDGDNNIDGDKIYAATGLGWDDPEIGWHHCPPGAGIYNSVLLEKRPEFFISDVFVRPSIDNGTIEVWTEIFNPHFEYKNFELKLRVFAENFEGGEVADIKCTPNAAGPGINHYKFRVDFNDYRLWTTETPWLYSVRVSTKCGEIKDEFDRTFGMRKFHMDTENIPKGRLYLNNSPIILRGANDMGHMQQCVAKNDMKQLIDDILIARMANMNFYRFTQRPVQEEIYDYCDRLGMLNQTDLPVFGYMRRNLFCEAIRQSEAMERFIRSHPSAIMVSYMNEACDPSTMKREHRYLLRQELEDMFECATKAVLINNPDRVIKNVEGDYDPPTRDGLSDFHCYNMWYTDHALPIGKLHKGWLPEIKEGWLTGCGEYGTEGLDNLDIMLSEYPKDWLPENLEDDWIPSRIIQSQTFSMHGDWFAEQSTLKSWIAESQRHQALATRLMTDAFRRRSDYVIQTAIHLLIDAWPAGWMKTLVDCKRRPKPAYFEFKRSLKSVRINLRTDRWHYWEGERAKIEVWTLNDSNVCYKDCVAVITVDGKNSYEVKTVVQPVSSDNIGIFEVDLPNGSQKTEFSAAIYDRDGNLLDNESLTVFVYDNKPKVSEAVSISEFKSGDKFVYIDKEGKYIIDGHDVEVKKFSSKYFLCSKNNNINFFMPYDKKTDMISSFTDSYIICDGLEPILYTYEKPDFNKFVKNSKNQLTVVGKLGDVYLFAFNPNGFIGVNPKFDMLLSEMEKGGFGK